MAYHSLREFVDRLENENELVRIKDHVSPILEITEITDRVSKQSDGGKALLFENVEGSNIPVLINAFGSFKRINIALGVHDIEKIPRDIDKYLKIKPPSSLLEKVKLLPMLLEAAAFPPKIVSARKGTCQEVVLTGNDVDLGIIPILQCWPNDAGRFITFPIVVNRTIDKKLRNVGLYRMQVYDKKTTGMHRHIHKDGAHFFYEFKNRNKHKLIDPINLNIDYYVSLLVCFLGSLLWLLKFPVFRYGYGYLISFASILIILIIKDYKFFVDIFKFKKKIKYIIIILLTGVLIKDSNRIYPNLYKNIDPWPGIYSANKIIKKKENTPIIKNQKIIFYKAKKGECYYSKSPCTHYYNGSDFKLSEINLDNFQGYKIYYFNN